MGAEQIIQMDDSFNDEVIVLCWAAFPTRASVHAFVLDHVRPEASRVAGNACDEQWTKKRMWVAPTHNP